MPRLPRADFAFWAVVAVVAAALEVAALAWASARIVAVAALAAAAELERARVAAVLAAVFFAAFCAAFFAARRAAIPIAIGISSLVNKETEQLADGIQEITPSFLTPQIYTVAAITIANGSDNISIYIPLFSSTSVENFLVII